MSDPFEFDCIDCEAHVISVTGKPPEFEGRCMTCQFLQDTITDRWERDKVREFLNKTRIIER